MTLPAPKIDQRTAISIAQQVQGLLKVYAPAWEELDPVTGVATGVSGALIGIFARFSRNHHSAAQPGAAEKFPRLSRFAGCRAAASATGARATNLLSGCR